MEHGLKCHISPLVKYRQNKNKNNTCTYNSSHRTRFWSELFWKTTI